ncbi:MAG: MBOAT family protein [Clostridiaceae bacterium]|nr:MBOAT family protein [Clostridiaceae bacterium]
MNVISVPFALLALISLLVFYLLAPRLRVMYLVLLSCGFIASYSYLLIIYLLLFVLINYYAGIYIVEARSPRIILRLGITFNILQLALLKYASFAIDPVFRLFDSDINVSKIGETLVPLGISYFTLQAIGYLINIKMGWEKPERSFGSFLLYISFFPKFLSGPIERSNHFLPQVIREKQFNIEQVTAGIRIALFGFFKKVVIANQLGLLITGTYSDLQSADTGHFIMVLLIQPLYLYFDFSGYTDIAIGLAKAFGYDLLPNFKRPFMSINVTTFWRRFHMSLSLWFNDYVFRQLSFKYRRWGKYASSFAVFITFILFGIWHGAGWNFMVLGLIQALALNYEFFTKNRRIAFFSKMPDNLRRALGRIITYLFFGFSLVFFFSADLESVFRFFSGLTNGISMISINAYGLAFYPALLMALLILLAEYIEEDHAGIAKAINKVWQSSSILRLSVYYIMIMCVLSFIGSGLIFVYQAF